MAVYYKWIKGCASGSTLTTGLWTYLKWGDGRTENGADIAAGGSINNLPHIYTYIGKKDNPETENDLGYILTNKATGVTLMHPWTLSDNVYFETGTNNCFVQHADAGNIEMSGEGYYKFTKGLHVAGEVELHSTLRVKEQTIINSELEATETSGALIVSGGVRIDRNLKVKNKIISDGDIASNNGSCTAIFFNATSDKRAKENIRPAEYSALNLIKKLPVYIYNYKNNTETVTGILAQDLLQAQPDELNLVSNINATGKNNDYMSIKNDKLMFVLMKAIQEQQEQIEQLKSEIANMKKSY